MYCRFPFAVCVCVPLYVRVTASVFNCQATADMDDRSFSCINDICVSLDLSQEIHRIFFAKTFGHF